eukprot:CAMPEP_0167797834 /NCGR_PEP_ID=MMETSP0111_2-20121227/15907_1 /TAXON_ID=91324 /ORGANISM="Lotharella globosa, Strain CCCM811" /LENGTH=276 /DNA_ID=CAMNT_0007692049 /DNA_START=167 /DNA_END=997 /DNA_ORIENTATION=+
MATHTDKHVHPILLEIMWHCVWWLGCVSLTYLIMVVFGIIAKFRKLSLSESLPVVNYVTGINLAWGIAFIVVAVVDGLRSDWPQPAAQWFMWTTCALYLLVGTCYAVNTLDTLVGNKVSQKAEGALNQLILFSYIIIVGLGMYSVFLPALGIIEVAFASKRTLRVEVIITVIHQLGMLCMGIGMMLTSSQLAKARFRRSRSRGSMMASSVQDLKRTGHRRGMLSSVMLHGLAESKNDLKSPDAGVRRSMQQFGVVKSDQEQNRHHLVGPNKAISGI